MSLRVVQTPESLADIALQSDYYAHRENIALAQRFTDAVKATVRLLATHPRIGKETDYEHPKLAGIRLFLVRKPFDLGAFPLRSLDDFTATAPASWLQRGGGVLPMDQSEALWISFSARYPCAVKIAAGKINAVSGAAWTAELPSEPQDDVVVPGQPWLDGFSVGAGDSVEEQLTGRADRADHPAGMRAGLPRARFWN